MAGSFLGRFKDALDGMVVAVDAAVERSVGPGLRGAQSGERLDVKVCQQNRNIPEKLFNDGFCQPTLAGQKVEVQYVDQCPSGAFGVCSNAQVANMPYRQDIHYYGVATDAAYLKPYCEGQSQGSWLKP
jgi:hypothetical protein